MNELFKIFLLTEERASEIAAMPDEHHFHDYEELLVGVEGSLEHFIDFKQEEFYAEKPLLTTLSLHRQFQPIGYINLILQKWKIQQKKKQKQNGFLTSHTVNLILK